MRLPIGKNILGLLFLMLGFQSQLLAQPRNIGQLSTTQQGTGTVGYDSQGRMIRKTKGNDSLQKRDSNAD